MFEEDLNLAKEFGLRSFQTMFFLDNAANKEIVYGSKSYAFYELAILKLHNTAIKSEYNRDSETLFSKYQSLTAKEFAELSGTRRDESEKLLNEVSSKGISKAPHKKMERSEEFKTSHRDYLIIK